jgi:hypothetical protein
MRRKNVSALIALMGAFSLVFVQAVADQTPTATSQPPAANSDAKPDSGTKAKTITQSKTKKVEKQTDSFALRCDGRPPHRSIGEIAGRVLLIMATSGLAGPGETADTGKRLKGDEAIRACTAAIAEETDTDRKIELTLARAVHFLEVKNYEDALKDARSAPALAGDEAKDLGYRHSLLVSAYELEAAALARQGRAAEAAEVGIKMASLAPYDLIAQQRAAAYIGLIGDITPAKRDYLDRFGRLLPMGLIYCAVAHEWAGEYALAAADRQAYMETGKSFLNEKSAPQYDFGTKAWMAIDLALAGDVAKSNATAAEAQKEIDELVRSGQSLKMPSAIAEAGEGLDFQAIIAQLETGNAKPARAAFAARSRWLTPSPALIAEVTARLRKGAKPDELTGTLARDPAVIRADGLAAKAGALIDRVKGEEALFAAIRTKLAASDYTTWKDDVRDTKDSSFLRQRNGKEKYEGEVVSIWRRNNGIPVGDAILMHSAFLAKARGATGFLLYPYRERLDTTVVRFGNPGEPGFPPRAVVDADAVITALSEEFPPPKPRTR